MLFRFVWGGGVSSRDTQLAQWQLEERQKSVHGVNMSKCLRTSIVMSVPQASHRFPTQTANLGISLSLPFLLSLAICLNLHPAPEGFPLVTLCIYSKLSLAVVSLGFIYLFRKKVLLTSPPVAGDVMSTYSYANKPL